MVVIISSHSSFYSNGLDSTKINYKIIRQRWYDLCLIILSANPTNLDRTENYKSVSLAYDYSNF